MRRVAVLCSNPDCAHKATLVVSVVGTFKCNLCGSKGVVVEDSPAELEPDAARFCCVCSEEVPVERSRIIAGKLYCIQHASELDGQVKRYSEKGWTDHKGATSWGKHD